MIPWLIDNAWWLTAAGIGMFLCGMGVLLVLAVTMPADHFVQLHGRAERPRHPAVRLLFRVVRNVIGVILFVLGLVMIIPLIPGPGVLFLVLGLSLMDIPGKRAVVRYVVSRPLVLQPLNALRARWNRPPLQVPRDA